MKSIWQPNVNSVQFHAKPNLQYCTISSGPQNTLRFVNLKLTFLVIKVQQKKLLNDETYKMLKFLVHRDACLNKYQAVFRKECMHWSYKLQTQPTWKSDSDVNMRCIQKQEKMHYMNVFQCLPRAANVPDSCCSTQRTEKQDSVGPQSKN